MNEGEFASRLGLAGIPREAEAIMLERDMRLVALTGARYHAALVTTSLSLEIIAKAKADGLAVTCATSINHLTLNENDIGDYRTFLKLAPPLRHEDERRALVAALAVRPHRRRSFRTTIRRMSRPNACRSPKRKMARSAWRRCLPRAFGSFIPGKFRSRASLPP